ncbi:uncharacterized protein LOC117649277 [Thrips palmi]|uniref:Uncharacterized protein LOC117649277 n=1 Tax=Thrips palmi TaxID=161013 RepID=A0A6P8ZAJ4_THRPL|nr:uncharacterized protein LOC117649277 [Thrips palmi]
MALPEMWRSLSIVLVVVAQQTWGRSNWIAMTPSRLLDSGAVQAGVFTDNLPTFVARVWHDNNILPGIARPNVGAWASWQDYEVKKENFEVLIADEVTWIPAANGVIPLGAQPTGVYLNGTDLYTCRVLDETAFILESGLIMKGQTVCSIPWQNRTALYPVYEVMLYK